MSSAYLTPNLKKSHIFGGQCQTRLVEVRGMYDQVLTSAAASISACQAFFPWPSMVAAIILYLHLGDDKRSAAFKKMADRSLNGKASHWALAFKHPSIDLLINLRRLASHSRSGNCGELFGEKRDFN